MRFEPMGKQVFGRLLITRVSEHIVASDPTKGVSKFVLLEEVGADAATAGYKIGDLVLPRRVDNVYLKGGSFHRVVLSIDDIVCRVHEIPLSEFVDINGKAIDVGERAA